MEKRPGGRTANYDPDMKHWRLRVRLDEAGIWFLSVFVREDGTFETYCLDKELAEDSHYKFKDERGLRKAIYSPGDEQKYLAEVLIRYIGQNSGEALEKALTPFVTAQLHFY